MKRNSSNRVLLALSFIWTVNSLPVQAAMEGKQSSVTTTNKVQPFSNRLIVKLRSGKTTQVMSVPQMRAEMSRPYSTDVIQQLQVAASASMSDIHAISNGAHVMTLNGTQNTQTVAQAIAGISKLSNVEYVEEDRIETIQVLPNDSYYTTGPTGNPGLWGMQAASAVAAVGVAAPGGTGNYGADFITAWASTIGTGVVVAVVDTGITPHVDIVGASGVVAAGAGSNLVSTGYNFISDCRTRGSCAATTADAAAYVAPSADATDTGDYVTAADVSANPALFSAVSSSSWHGTHVAGTIAALGNNAIGVIGGAYNAKILPVRALGKGGGFSSDISEAIIWAAGVPIAGVATNPNPAKVINLSLGSLNTCNTTRQNAINAAVAAGAVVVVAAGNDNQDVANSSSANCQNVISVAAIARDGSRAVYSNYSSPASNTTNPVNVTLAAQGGDQTYAPTFDPGILSTINSGTTTPVLTGGSAYAYYQGTSMATPHVSAAVALMLASSPALASTPAMTAARVKTILSSSSSLTPFPTFGAGLASWDCRVKQNCGAGILNAKLAVQNSNLPFTVSPASLDFGSVAATSLSNSKTVTLTNNSVNPIPQTYATTTGSDSPLFSTSSNTCGASIASGASCTITVNYSPSTIGTHSAILYVYTSTATVALAGITGKAGSVLTVTPAQVTAPTVTAGQSTTVSLSFTNPNSLSETTATLAFSNPTIMAASADTCSNVTLASGASCSVTVIITPTAAGSYSGTASLALSIMGSAPAVSATITGTATAAPVAASSGGGGGCAIMPFGANPDVSLLLAMLAVGAYWLRRRVVFGRSAD